MQIAAQIRMTPANSRECRGHRGNHFVPVFLGDGRWVYYWLSLPQAWFWRSRNAKERMELVRIGNKGCFVCGLQNSLEKETLFLGP